MIYTFKFYNVRISSDTKLYYQKQNYIIRFKIITSIILIILSNIHVINLKYFSFNIKFLFIYKGENK